MTNAEATAFFNAQTTAEKFVDEVTLLRMVRVKFPHWNPSDYGIDGTAISDRYMSGGDGRREPWETEFTDVAHRFNDGSLAIRQRATQRWEVYRSW